MLQHTSHTKLFLERPCYRQALFIVKIFEIFVFVMHIQAAKQPGVFQTLFNMLATWKYV